MQALQVRSVHVDTFLSGSLASPSLSLSLARQHVRYSSLLSESQSNIPHRLGELPHIIMDSRPGPACQWPGPGARGRPRVTLTVNLPVKVHYLHIMIHTARR
jgi:hypothetical protein